MWCKTSCKSIYSLVPTITPPLDRSVPITFFNTGRTGRGEPGGETTGEPIGETGAETTGESIGVGCVDSCGVLNLKNGSDNGFNPGEEIAG